MTVRPLEVQEIAQAFAVDVTLAKAIHRKTGGHPLLSEKLARATSGELNRLADCLDVAETAASGDGIGAVSSTAAGSNRLPRDRASTPVAKVSLLLTLRGIVVLQSEGCSRPFLKVLTALVADLHDSVGHLPPLSRVIGSVFRSGEVDYAACTVDAGRKPADSYRCRAVVAE
jgi:hypothetical protein